MKKPISLFYARQGVGGGSTSYTVHLMAGMILAGLPATLYRLTDKPRKPKMLAAYEGITCEYVTPDQARAIVRSTPSLLLAPERDDKLPAPGLLTELMREGLRVVIHDPNEFMSLKGDKKGVFNHLDDRSLVKDPICIRPSMKEHFPKATFIPHPYTRQFDGWRGHDLRKRLSACSIARLTFVKRPRIILDANRLLDPAQHIKFHSLENRLFTFSLKGKYPEVTQGGYNLPLEWGASAVMAAKYRFAVDMTYFPMDGGGSQYSFMEAWDAGCVNVIHKDWLRYAGEMDDGVNCWAVSGPEELADIIRNHKKHERKLDQISRQGAEAALNQHDAAAVARRYYKELA